jgi:tetratricopeptide (TPR) repeat protein
LLDLVRERYPAAVDRLAGVAAAASARTGQLEELVSPLNDPSLCTEHRLTIERAIQEQVSDLAALAECPALPSEHPLRKGAAALRQALEAVTSGPVGEEALALPEVSRRSPLASWKMLVRAIAAFYRREDETCRRYLGAIQPEAAAARLVPALQAMLDGTPGTTKPAPSAELVSRISSDVLALRHAIDDLDQAFESAEDDRHILDAIRVAVQACRRSAPGQVERLKQHISVRAAIEQLDIDKTRGAMGGPAHHDAYFYRLFAHSREQDAVDAVELLAACLTWNEFRLKAVEEGWFSPNGMAVATLYLHMAKLLGDIPEDLIRSFEQTHRTSKGASSEDLFFLHPDELYERACVLDPHSEAFSQWMGWAKGKSRTEAERVAEAWHKIRPQDIEPVLYLMAGYEERGAFPTALQYLVKAERIDGVNPEVRRARLRLLAGQTIRSIQQKKTASAEQSLKELCALPQSQQGDRPAFLAALRYMIATLEGRLSEAQVHRAEMERLLESQLAATLLISSVAGACKRSELQKLEPVQKLSKAERAGLPGTLVRLHRLARDVQFGFRIPPNSLAEAAQQFRRVHQTLDVSQLRTLGEAALQSGDSAFAYAVSAAGLERGGPTEGEFLFLRAQSLPPANFERRMVCAAAAAKLARQQGQHEVAGKALDFLHGPFRDGSIQLTPAQLDEVLEKEKQERSYPKGKQRGPKYRSIIGDRLCDCIACRRERGEDIGDLGDVFDVDDEEFDELLDELEIPDGMPPAIAKMLVGEMARAIANGESPEEFMARMSGAGPIPETRSRKGRRK